MKDCRIREKFLNKPQLIARNRLLDVGEIMRFIIYLPGGFDKGFLRIYPRFLEQAKLNGDDVCPLELAEWLNDEAVQVLDFVPDNEGYAQVAYTPNQPGSYLLRWTVGGEDLFRYFSAIGPDYTVTTFATFFEADPQPSFHNLGIPVDYRLPADRFTDDDPLCRRLAEYHRLRGDLVVLQYPDTPELGVDERAQVIGAAIENAKQMLPDENDFRSIRIDMQHYIDYGYTQSLKKLGVVDHCGLWEANGGSWLGMPEFFYYSADNDCRKTDQDSKGRIMAHQWDFCVGFHFPGPVTWHYRSAHGVWDKTEHCVRQALSEAENCAAMSGHPAFITPLYEGLTPFQGYEEPNDPDYLDGKLEQFIQRYKMFYAFQATRDFKLVFSRSIDIVDYYLRHFNVTPRTVYSSKTDHITYDSWWQCVWTNYKLLAARERLPWLTNPVTVASHRENNTHFKTPWGTGVPLKDALSYEYIIMEDQRRSLRFERECPNPIWWFDYTDPAPYYSNSQRIGKVAPYVQVDKTLHFDNRVFALNLKMTCDISIEDYFIAVWDVPVSIYKNPTLQTEGAKEYLMVRNTDGECHLVIRFDLKPDSRVSVSWSA